MAVAQEGKNEGFLAPMRDRKGQLANLSSNRRGALVLKRNIECVEFMGPLPTWLLPQATINVRTEVLLPGDR